SCIVEKTPSNEMNASPAKIAVDRITPDTPLRLAVAAAVAYPDGSMTAHGLRKEAANGRLVLEFTAGRYYTTLNAIARMRQLCQSMARGRDSGYDGKDATATAESPKARSGSSVIEAGKRAQDAALTVLQTLSENWRSTSRTSTSTAPPKGSARHRAS